jgi:hypothetical protein
VCGRGQDRDVSLLLDCVVEVDYFIRSRLLTSVQAAIPGALLLSLLLLHSFAMGEKRLQKGGCRLLAVDLCGLDKLSIKVLDVRPRDYPAQDVNGLLLEVGDLRPANTVGVQFAR